MAAARDLTPMAFCSAGGGTQGDSTPSGVGCRLLQKIRIWARPQARAGVKQLAPACRKSSTVAAATGNWPISRFLARFLGTTPLAAPPDKESPGAFAEPTSTAGAQHPNCACARKSHSQWPKRKRALPLRANTHTYTHTHTRAHTHTHTHTSAPVWLCPN